MEAYPSSNKQTNIWKKKEKQKIRQITMWNKEMKKNRQKPENVMNFDGWKKIFSYLALKWCPYTQIQFICLALLMNWRIGEMYLNGLALSI